MNADRARELWTRFLEGEELSPEEEQELLEAVRQDETLRREFAEDDGIAGLLEAAGAEEAEADDFAEAFAVRLEAERDASGFIDRVRVGMSSEPPAEWKKVSRGAFRRRGSTAPSASWGVFLAAAGVLLAFGLIFLVFQPSANRPIRTARKPVTSSAPKSEPVIRETPPAPAPPEPQTPERLRPRPAPLPVPSTAGAPRPRLPAPEERKFAVPPPVRKAPAPKPRTVTQIVVATLTGNGDVRVNGRETRSGNLNSGDAVETRGQGAAELRFPDSTRVRLEGESRLADLRDSGGKRMRLEAGTLDADVEKQTDPMEIDTPHARATVLGTTLRVLVGADSTRLEVTEGRVRLTRKSDGKSVEVRAGHYAVAAAGVPLQSKSLASPEIVLLPKDGRLVGTDWQVVRDPEASSGVALEAVQPRRTPTIEELNQLTSWIEYRFYAEAGKTYVIWVRGRCTAARNLFGSDAVNVRPLNAVLTRPDGTRVDGRMNYNGYACRPGYWWVGGDGDLFGPQGKRMAANPTANARHGDEIPLRVRFAKTGWQTLKIYANESPMRIDAVWLSRSRTTRPADSMKAPDRK